MSVKIDSSTELSNITVQNIVNDEKSECDLEIDLCVDDKDNDQTNFKEQLKKQKEKEDKVILQEKQNNTTMLSSNKIIQPPPNKTQKIKLSDTRSSIHSKTIHNSDLYDSIMQKNGNTFSKTTQQQTNGIKYNNQNKTSTGVIKYKKRPIKKSLSSNTNHIGMLNSPSFEITPPSPASNDNHNYSDSNINNRLRV